jgi:hypothetical protein
MASVIEFVWRERAPRKDAVAQESAEIIIFPGVRFERIDFDAEIFEPEGPQAPPHGRGVKNQRAAKS